jgi:hypothetical protein
VACLGGRGVGGAGGKGGGVIRFVGAEFTSHNNHEFLIISHTNPFLTYAFLFSRI